MSRYYSISTFLRQVPNALLDRYFQTRGVHSRVKLQDVGETDTERLMEMWNSFPGNKQGQMEAECRVIFEMSCEKGFRAILDEAKSQLGETSDEYVELVEKLTLLGGHYERAMTVFLDHQIYWKGGTRFYRADTISAWRKRKNLPRKTAATDRASRNRLAELMSSYFHYTEGRGSNCLVEYYRRGDRDYFFAYPEDYSQHSIEWQNGKFERRPHKPAFEIIYVYCQKDGTLDVHHRGPYRAIESLHEIFVKAILNEDLPPDPKDERVYNLNPLASQDFRFNYDPSSGIERVAVKKLRLSSKVNRGDRIIFEANTGRDDKAVYELLDKTLLPKHRSQYHVTQVEIGAVVATFDSESPKSTTIRITHPNSCSLKYDEVDLKLRAMLEASGIEPKKPQEVD